MYSYYGNILRALLVLDGNVIIQVYCMCQLLLMLVRMKLVNLLDSTLNGRYVCTYIMWHVFNVRSYVKLYIQHIRSCINSK